MKLALAFALMLIAGANAGLIQSYRQGGNFAYAFNTQHHQAVPPMYYLPFDRTYQPINYADPNEMVGYSDPFYPYYMHPELSVDDELFRTGEQTDVKLFRPNPTNTAHATVSTPGIPIITSSASAISTSNGMTTSSGSAPNAAFQYPLLRLYHRIFNRAFSLFGRPNRPLSIPSVSSIFSGTDSVVINAV